MSGARSCAAFVPPSFCDLLGPHKSVALEHRSVMIAELLRGSWPPSARPRPDEAVHPHPCKVCGQRLTTLWLHRGLSLSCEEKVRSEGSCPYSERCGRTSFCRHQRRCFVESSGLVSSVVLFEGTVKMCGRWPSVYHPQRCFSTLTGPSATRVEKFPLWTETTQWIPDLASVCAGHPFVRVVTRSSRKDDIETFLNSKRVRIAECAI